jgi:hypothetical protein
MGITDDSLALRAIEFSARQVGPAIIALKPGGIGSGNDSTSAFLGEDRPGAGGIFRLNPEYSFLTTGTADMTGNSVDRQRHAGFFET